jgi:uncharacterized protein (TIGR02646 family)
VIRISKPGPPLILQTRGRDETRKMCAAFDASPRAYLRGRRKFAFDRDLYAHPSVKAALRAAQHEKCAFCESKFSHVGYGDVEHLRPKAGYKQHADDSLHSPGYYWLAYEWGNLFFSCQLCNQRFKKNLFPLRNARKRARSHHHDLSAEKPLLIDPSAVDPAQSLAFRTDDAFAFAIEDNSRGRTTIEVLGLNRRELMEVRRDRLRTIQVLLEVRDHLARQVRRKASPALRAQLDLLADELATLTDDQAAYAALARAACAAAAS